MSFILTDQAAPLALARLFIVNLLMSLGVFAASNGVTFLFPTEGLTLYYLDTINVTYESDFSAPNLYTFCDSGNDFIRSTAAAPYNGSTLVLLNFTSSTPCYFDLRPGTAAGQGANSDSFTLVNSQRGALTVGLSTTQSPTSTTSTTASTSTGTSSSSAVPTTSSATALTTTTSAAPTTTTTAAASGGDKLSTGAAAGIGVGATIAVIGLGAALAWWFWRRRVARKAAAAATDSHYQSAGYLLEPPYTGATSFGQSGHGQEMTYGDMQKQYAPGSLTTSPPPPSELSGAHAAAELSGNPAVHPAELR
ncbi:hypothetical protein BX600DRAFT_493572 [Xylariales sp. PMI_506]|nr:hypothetical protein BX600DRAFT_493572 [Xylariales sp. PMI_506]